MMERIPDALLKEKCKPGAQDKTCRFLTYTGAWCCAKHSELHGVLDARAKAGILTAQGDNCNGLDSLVNNKK